MKYQVIDGFKFRGYNKTRIDLVGNIFDYFIEKRFQANLRQIHYKLLDVDYRYDNTDIYYQKLSKLITNGRMSGVLDWNVVIDESRASWNYNSWDSAYKFLQKQAGIFRLDRTEGQDYHVEVWTEKFGVSNVLSQIAAPYQIPVVNNRGYCSTTYAWNAAVRFAETNKPVRIIYLGDHDPSGLNMIDDLLNRLGTLSYALGFEFEIEPIALTMEQIQKFAVKENFVKINDKRAAEYIEKFGHTSWELDAMDLEYLQHITEYAIQQYIDIDTLNYVINKEGDEREKITRLIKGFEST